jgi:hypothetical protein
MKTKYDWNFTTVPMEFAGNRVIDVPAGKLIGGLSSPCLYRITDSDDAL